MEERQRRKRRAAVLRRAGRAAAAQPRDLLLFEPAVSFDPREGRIVVRIEAVEYGRRFAGRRIHDRQLHVGQLARRVERVEAPRGGGHQPCNLPTREILFGIVVAQNDAVGDSPAGERIEQPLPHPRSRAARYHVTREDQQVGTLRADDPVDAREGLLRFGLPLRSLRVEVQVGELYDAERAVGRETKPLRPRRRRIQTQEQQKAPCDHSLHDWSCFFQFSLTSPLWATWTVRHSLPPQRTVRSKGSSHSTRITGRSVTLFRRPTRRLTTPSGPKG